jgi:hypothetical protein
MCPNFVTILLPHVEFPTQRPFLVNVFDDNGSNGGKTFCVGHCMIACPHRLVWVTNDWLLLAGVNSNSNLTCESLGAANTSRNRSLVACTKKCVWVMSRFILIGILVLYLLSVVHFDNNRQTSHKNPMTIPPLMRGWRRGSSESLTFKTQKRGLCVVVVT